MVLDNPGWGTGTLGACSSVPVQHSTVTTQAAVPGILGSLGSKSQGASCLSVKELTGTKEDHWGPSLSKVSYYRPFIKCNIK